MNISFTELNTYNIENFHSEILKELESTTSSFILDFEGVEKVDLINIQLILSLKKYCDEKDIGLKLINIKAKQIKQTFRLFHLDKMVEIVL